MSLDNAFEAPGEEGVRPTVLLVDDDDTVRLTAKHQLEDLGFEVVAAASGDEALDLLACDRTIDVLILRLRRKIEPNPRLPELICTERGAGYVFRASVSKTQAA